MAGLRFFGSLPTDVSKSTHQTSPRFIGHVSDKTFYPFEGLRFAFLVRSHFSICGVQVIRNDVWPHERLNELTNITPPDSFVETLINALV